MHVAIPIQPASPFVSAALAAFISLMALLLWTPTAACATDGDFPAALVKAPREWEGLSSKLIRRLSPLVGARDAVALVSPSGKIVYARNLDLALIPASTLKVLTSLAALQLLGPDYRFETKFYVDHQQNLKVLGFGDPLLISEVLAKLGNALAQELIHFNDLILDDSYFQQPLSIPGRQQSLQPYDAPGGAICVNFNTVEFRCQASRCFSAEPQTPLLPFAEKKIRASGMVAGRITLSADNQDSLSYAGEMIRYFLAQSSVTSGGSIRSGRVDLHSDRLIYTHRSPFALTELVSKLLEFSNNFIANQIFFTLGAHQYGPPASLEKGVMAVTAFARGRLGLTDFRLVEGSGLSRSNRISARAMLKVLEEFSAYRTLMQHRGRQWYKTGTLQGISTRVGYLESDDGAYFRFVIFLNTPGKPAAKVAAVLERGLVEAQRQAPFRDGP